MSFAEIFILHSKHYIRSNKIKKGFHVLFDIKNLSTWITDIV